MIKRRLLALGLTLVMSLSTFSFVGCTDANKTQGNNESQTQAENYDGKLELDHKMELKYAKLFSVEYYKGGYKLIKLTNRDEDSAVVSKTSTILMVPDGMSVPKDIDSETIVLKNNTNMIVGSTPVTSLMNASNCLSNISMVTYDKDSWYIDDVKKAFDDKKLTYVGDYKAPNFETIVANSPSISIWSSMLSSVPDVAAKLKELGVNYILDQSTYEDEPLGRVEWAKLYAALCNQEDAATKMFDQQEAYVNEVSKAAKTNKKVAIFYITSKGVLYARNAGDYMAKMVNMAGGEYIFNDLNKEKTGTQTMAMEEFYNKAKDADVIIYVWSLGGKPASLADFTAYNDVLKDIKAVKEGNVWCTTPDYFQITDTIGSMIKDMNSAFNADSKTDKLTYLYRLK